MTATIDFVRTVREVKIERRARRSRRRQGVNDDDTGVAFDDRHARYGKAADLIDAVRDLEQSVRNVELGLTPQTWVDGRRRLMLQK